MISAIADKLAGVEKVMINVTTRSLSTTSEQDFG
jgi:hypothetical protein